MEKKKKMEGQYDKENKQKQPKIEVASDREPSSTGQNSLHRKEAERRRRKQMENSIL